MQDFFVCFFFSMRVRTGRGRGDIQRTRQVTGPQLPPYLLRGTPGQGGGHKTQPNLGSPAPKAAYLLRAVLDGGDADGVHQRLGPLGRLLDDALPLARQPRELLLLLVVARVDAVLEVGGSRDLQALLLLAEHGGAAYGTWGGDKNEARRRTEAGRWERSTLLRPSCFYYTMAQQPKQTGSFWGSWEHFPQRFPLQRVDLGIFGGFCCADAGPAAFSTPWRSTGLVRGAQIVLPPRQLPFAQPTLMQRSQI